jgi:signal transduction histidine kinase
MRWSEVAPRSWTLGGLARGILTADSEALRISLDALLENAVKYTQPTDVITLSARAAGDELLIEVGDEGSGIPPDALGAIFDRFARADAGRSRAEGGAGLGLAIVDAIARAHGGRCVAASTEVGAAFTLRFPGFAQVRERQPLHLP